MRACARCVGVFIAIVRRCAGEGRGERQKVLVEY